MRVWLQRRARAGDIDMFVAYPFARCFVLTRFPAVTGALASDGERCGRRFLEHLDAKGERGGCVAHGAGNLSAVDWRRSRVAIEFHAEVPPQHEPTAPSLSPT